MRNSKLLVMLLALVLALAMTFGIVACGDDEVTETTAAPTETTAAPTETTAAPTETTAAPTETTAAAGFKGEINIGGLGSMTGQNAMTGAEMIWAYERAVKDINAAGGVKLPDGNYELKLTMVDDKTDATEGAAGAEKLIKAQGIKLILSSNITPINLAAGIVAEKYECYYQIATSWTDYIDAQDFKWVSDIFFTPQAATEIPFNVANLMPESDRPQNWCMLTEDNTDGEGMAAGAVAVSEAFGYKTAMVERYTPGTKDFSSIILKLKQNNIDALITLIGSADAITFMKQMKEQDYSPKLLFGWKGFWPTEFMTSLGADSDYAGHDGFWSEGNGAPGSAELGQAFKDEHDGLDSVSIGLSYANVQILAQAIEKAGSTEPAAVRDQVFGGSFEGTTMGDVTYNDQGICDVAPYGLWWKDGKRVQYWPEAGNQIEWFVPWDQR
ncbi:MAG: amino acid ABC transporter substrate-binding protein [Thermoleophilia bacterium]|nr:amino acid ABC transporter substrate-binding protein [Thermoleophilia bacterium]